MNRKLWVILSISCLTALTVMPACEDEIRGNAGNAWGCDPSCQNCVNGVCQDADKCDPDCTNEQICINGICTNKGAICNPSCTDEQVCFNNVCVTPAQCDPQCTGNSVCINGECIEPGVCKPSCNDEQICVNGACIDPWRVCKNGTTPVVCDDLQVCTDDKCNDPGNLCTTDCGDKECFNGVCVNKGECEQTCEAGSVCINGKCEKPGVCAQTCAKDLACINGQCVDPDFCKPDCTDGKVCEKGECVNPGTLCDPACQNGQICFNQHCIDPGTCDPKCEGDSVCINGACIEPGCTQTCTENAICVNGVCVDPKPDCKPEDCDGQFCSGDKCVNPGTGICEPLCDNDKTCFAGACVPTADNCDPQCDFPAVCINGNCVGPRECDPACTDPELCINGKCVDPNFCNPECTNGMVCVKGQCVNPGEVCDPECTEGEVCFNGRCIVPGTDCEDCKLPNVCINKKCYKTGCDPACTDPSICVNGVCVSPKPECKPDACENQVCTVKNPASCEDPGAICTAECADKEECFQGVCVDKVECEQTCETGNICINGKCEDPKGCNPGCKDTEVCVNNKCIDPNFCNPECKDNQVCIKGVCIDKADQCDPACQDDQICFHNRCIDPDPTCKDCAYPSACINGVCHDPGCNPVCTEPAVCINGACINPKSECDDICQSAQMCIDDTPASCGDPGSVCTPKCDGKTCFLGICTDPGTGCDPACQDPQICINGKCEDPNICTPDCTLPEVCINGKCADPNFCNPECKDDQVCVNGVCTDPGNICNPECKPEEMCVNNKCVPKGQCNPDCKLPEVCINGKCIDPGKCDPACSPNQKCVNGICVDPKPACTPKCIEGEYCAYDDCHNPGHLCTPRCSTGQACFNNSCIDVVPGDCEDANGGSLCASDEICINNKCINPGKCESDCPTGEICVNARCIDPNFCAPDCKANQICVQGECIDPNVPGCTEECKNGQVCINGTCQDPECTQGQVFQNGKCVDPKTICNPECKTGEICENNQCKKDCGSKARCGVNEDICCENDDEICVNPICVKKGKDCEKLSDCDFYEYCDPITNTCVNADDAGGKCEVKPASDDVKLALKFHWPYCLSNDGKSNPYAKQYTNPKDANRYERVISMPMAAPFDTNGDGKIDDKDQTLIAFIAYSNGAGPDQTNNLDSPFKSKLILIAANKEHKTEGDNIPACIEVAKTEANYYSYPTSMAIADIDNDGLPEIVIGTKDKTSPKLQALTLKKDADGFKLEEKYALPIWSVFKTSMPSVAYLDPKNDKYPSILLPYGVAMIQEEKNGENTVKKLAWRGEACKKQFDAMNLNPLVNAADLDADGVMEIVAPNGIYDHQCNLLVNKLSDDSAFPGGRIAIADLMPSGNDAKTTGELIPELAHVINGDNSNTDKTKHGKFVFTKLFKKDGAWSAKKVWENEIPVDPVRAANKKNYNTGGGHPVIANFDGSKYPGVGVASRYYYIVYGNDGTANGGKVLWADGKVQDFSSAVTGSSVFDFNGDGKAEVVYSSETTLYVYDGAGSGKDADGDKFNDPKTILSIPNFSLTGYEYPIIADVDDDGSTEIVVVSDCNHTLCSGNSSDPDTLGVNVYTSGGEKWVRSRRIWNQHQYHITNINDDGTVPKPELANWLQPKLNNFRQNVQPSGIHNAPDLTPKALTLNPVNCPTFIHLTALIRNIGTLTATNAISVKFYVQDYNGTGNNALIGSVDLSTAVHPGEDLTIKYTWVDRKGIDVKTNAKIDEIKLPAKLFYVVDEPSDNKPNGNVTECKEDNNSSTVFTLNASCTLTK